MRAILAATLVSLTASGALLPDANAKQVGPPCCSSDLSFIAYLQALNPQEDESGIAARVRASLIGRSREQLDLYSAELNGYCGTSCTGVYGIGRRVLEDTRDGVSHPTDRLIFGGPVLGSPSPTPVPSGQASGVNPDDYGIRASLFEDLGTVEALADEAHSPAQSGPRPARPVPAPSAEEIALFANATLRALADWDRPIDEIPSWLDPRVAGMSPHSLRVVRTTIVAHCASRTPCQESLSFTAAYLEGVENDRLRSEEAEMVAEVAAAERASEQIALNRNVEMATWAIFTSALVSFLCTIISAWVTFQSGKRGDERTREAMIALTQALSQTAKKRQSLGRRHRFAVEVNRPRQDKRY